MLNIDRTIPIAFSNIRHHLSSSPSIDLLDRAIDITDFDALPLIRWLCKLDETRLRDGIPRDENGKSFAVFDRRFHDLHLILDYREPSPRISTLVREEWLWKRHDRALGNRRRSLPHDGDYKAATS